MKILRTCSILLKIKNFSSSGLGGWENDNFLVKTAKRLGLASKFLKVHPKASVALVKCQDDGEAILKPGEVTKIFRANPVFLLPIGKRGTSMVLIKSTNALILKN
ncbi:hypothetical protein [Methanoculleus chikugoensis]|uniref:hypothetical protein n=1 Tax=Methanoculleus chikugoensis TaxID=118126 RepID=UPI001FB30781|nr:hypothetical protein [Methanoculleus chikugoensis]